MGKKRRIPRLLRWMKSDLPDDNKSVLLVGVTKIPSPSLSSRSRPCTVHVDYPTKSHTLNSLPSSNNKNAQSLTSHKSLSDDSIYESTENSKLLSRRTFDFETYKLRFIDSPLIEKLRLRKNKDSKKVSFDKKLGFCKELPFEYYHPNNKRIPDVCLTNDVGYIEQGIMDKSVDSIGSCSLDVDASSTDFSDSSVDSSNCTLRSLGIPTPIKENLPIISTTQPLSSLQASVQGKSSSLYLSSVSSPKILRETKNITEAETKKPSYLNLACTVNGYSNITNYDSRNRDIFRIPKSREVSPIRPQDHVTNITQEKSTYLSPNYNPTEMAESRSIPTSYTFSSTNRTMTYMSKETTNFVKKMLHDDTVDSCLEKRDKPKYIYETNKISQCSYTNGQEKSFSETTVRETYSNNRKSFIQQRVERLYGPAALAQGFFITNRMKNRNSESENGENGHQDYSKPDQDISALPVLRHLRPEFRAQLPILSPKRSIYENSIQKSTTVPSSLTSVTNGVDNKKSINTSKSVEHIENKENIEKQIILDSSIKKEAEIRKNEVITNKIIEDIPAAPQVILPISTPEKSKNELNGVEKHNGIVCVTQVKDGHYFLKMLKNETDRLIKLAEKVEDEMENKKTEIPEEVLGYLRSASGKARLLVTQKMQQFEGLCHKNINQKPGEPFPTTSEDLQGFWDMVMLQVTQVDKLFAEIDSLRENKWIIPEKPKSDNVDSSKAKKIIIKKTISANTEAQRKQREAARKKMIEERRKAMREKQEQENGIEIFVPESS